MIFDYNAGMIFDYDTGMLVSEANMRGLFLVTLLAINMC